MPPDERSEADLIGAARQALGAWAIEATSVALVARSENLVFRVEADTGRAYVLRLHRPGYNSLAELESEHAWTAALNAAGVDAPRALRTVDGAGYAAVRLPDGSERLAGVVEWVEGELLADVIAREADERRVTARFERLGAVVARIHNQSSGWRAPAGFVRRAWDADGLMGERPLWGRFWAVPEVDAAARETLLRARDAIHRALVALGTDRSRYSLIHADLHTYNVVVAGDDRLCVIDFDDAGFGWHLHELAVALHAVRDRPYADAARAALLAGYRSARPFSAAHERLLPMFLLIRSLALIGWMHDRRELGTPERVARLIERTVREAEAFLASRVA